MTKLNTTTWAALAMLFSAVILGIQGFIPLVVVFFSALLLGTILVYRRSARLSMRLLYWTVALVLGLAIGMYRPAGFNYPQIIALSELYPGGQPFALYANLGKATAGFITLLLLLHARHPLFKPVTTPLARAALVLILAGVVLATAIPLGELQWHPKSVNAIINFAWVNLLITCVAEEAFLRLLVQRELGLLCERLTQNRFVNEALPLALTTALFLVTHGVNDANLVVIYGVAGGLYALCYTLSKSVFSCIALHFLVNFIHFSFLTYPIHAA